MAKYGTDILYLALGIGAVYAISKLVKPITKTTESVGSAIGDVSTAAGTLASNIFKGVDNGIVTPMFQTAADATSGNIGGALSSLKKAVTTVSSVISYPIPQITESIGKTIIDSVNTIKQTVSPASNTPMVVSPTSKAIPTTVVAYEPSTHTAYGTYQSSTGGVSGIIPASKLNYTPYVYNREQALSFSALNPSK